MKVGLVLAHELENENGEVVLSKRTQQRTDKGIDLFKSGLVDKLIMSGDYEKRYGISLAKAMKNYAIKKGVRENRIIEEDISLETVGELIFTKLGILNPRNWKDIVIITGKDHSFRVREEARYLLKDFNIEYGAVNEESFDEIEKQRKSLEAFKKTFGEVDFENDYQILDALLSKHPYYNKNPEYFRSKLANLKKKNTEN